MDVETIIDEVTRDGDAGSSVVTLINKIVEGIDDASNKTQREELGDALNENANEIADAVLANTASEGTGANATDPDNPTGEKRGADGQPFFTATDEGDIVQDGSADKDNGNDDTYALDETE